MFLAKLQAFKIVFTDTRMNQRFWYIWLSLATPHAFATLTLDCEMLNLPSDCYNINFLLSLSKLFVKWSKWRTPMALKPGMFNCFVSVSPTWVAAGGLIWIYGHPKDMKGNPFHHLTASWNLTDHCCLYCYNEEYYISLQLFRALPFQQFNLHPPFNHQVKIKHFFLGLPLRFEACPWNPQF